MKENRNKPKDTQSDHTLSPAGDISEHTINLIAQNTHTESGAITHIHELYLLYSSTSCGVNTASLCPLMKHLAAAWMSSRARCSRKKLREANNFDSLSLGL